MTRVATLLLTAVLLSSCASYYGNGFFGFREPLRQPAAIAVPESYTKAEVDAINAEITCRSLARNPIQAAQCGVRR